MKTSELRLGNYVKCGDKTLCIAVINNEIIEYISENIYDVCSVNAISPLPLTKDLLLKLEAQRGWDGKNVYYIIHAEEEDIYILYKDGIYYHANEYDSTVYETIPCTGLHSLQNKYYALNGEEMEVKL